MRISLTRREWLTAGAVTLSSPRIVWGARRKSMHGAFIILATPYTESKEVDFEDLAAEVEFLDRSGVQGMVWPQNASELGWLSREERMKGMEVLARAARGRSPALVLGVQGRNTEAMLEYARHAESLNPDALIAIPPTEANSLEDYREYYSELGRLTSRPVFIQTGGGAPEIKVSAEFVLETARKFPNLGYVKDEHEVGFEHFERKRKLAKHSPDPIKSVLTAGRARAWTYEMRLGAHGVMTGGPMYAEVYALIWRLHQEGERDRLREVFGKLLMMTILEQHIPGVKPYMMKRRGLFKTSVSRVWENVLTPAQVDEIEYKFKGLEPYLNG